MGGGGEGEPGASGLQVASERHTSLIRRAGETREGKKTMGKGVFNRLDAQDAAKIRLQEKDQKETVGWKRAAQEKLKRKRRDGLVEERFGPSQDSQNARAGARSYNQLPRLRG